MKIIILIFDDLWVVGSLLMNFYTNTNTMHIKVLVF